MNRGAYRQRGLRRFGALACVVPLLAACSSAPRPWEAPVPAGPRRYEAISEATVEEVRSGVRQYERGQLEKARGTFQAALVEAPNDLRVAIWLQEATLAGAERRAEGIGGALAGGNSPRAQLRRRYRREAESSHSPAAYVLAARLEDDRQAAELLLAKALEQDPRMAWAHYALAHAAARAGDWGRAHDELERTFELEPDHLPALRLLAWSHATAGELDQAIAAYEAWLERADEDWLATESMRNTIELDLALAFLNADEPKRAARLLAELEGARVDEVRRQAALAAALEAIGRPGRAREAALAAQAVDPAALLPVVQEALLLELWLGDPWAARAAWRRVLELSAGQADLAAGMQRFRAQVHLQRLNQQGLRGVP